MPWITLMILFIQVYGSKFSSLRVKSWTIAGSKIVKVVQKLLAAGHCLSQDYAAHCTHYSNLV